MNVGPPRLGRPSSKLCVATWNVKPYFLTQRLCDRLHGDIADDISAKLTRPSLSLSELDIASLFVRMIKLTIIMSAFACQWSLVFWQMHFQSSVMTVQLLRVAETD